MKFSELIEELDSGQLDCDVSASLRDLVGALSARAAQGGTATGEVALKLKFAAASNGRVEITAEASLKAPGPRKAAETRWIAGKGELSSADPRQGALPLKHVT